MILLENETNYEIDINNFTKIIKYLKIEKDIELIITNNQNIQKLNKEFRNKNRATDVLSFPLENIPFAPLGVIVISLDKAKEISKKLSHNIDEELTLLFIHGVLHLLGYDHEVDSGEMRKKEEEIISYFNLPKSLIIRNSK